MSTENKTGKKRSWLPPLLLALPYLGAVLYAAYRLGPTLLRVISVVIKGAVVS